MYKFTVAIVLVSVLSVAMSAPEEYRHNNDQGRYTQPGQGSIGSHGSFGSGEYTQPGHGSIGGGGASHGNYQHGSGQYQQPGNYPHPGQGHLGQGGHHQHDSGNYQEAGVYTKPDSGHLHQGGYHQHGY